MFDSLQEAIDIGSGKRQQDGGVPVFELKAMPKAGVDAEPGEYEDVEWVTIYNKGDPKNIIERPVRPEDKKRWPDHYKAFLENKEPPLDGVPLEDFPKISPAERARCAALKLRTVEDLAGYPDGQIKDLGGRGHALQAAAREFLAYKDAGGIDEMQKMIAELQKELKELKSGNSTGSDTKRSTRNKPAKTKRSNGRRSGSGGKGVSDSEDSGEAAE